MEPKYIYAILVIVSFFFSGYLERSYDPSVADLGSLIKIITYIAMWIGIGIMFVRF